MVYVMNSNELYHHGIKGQKWGIRRYQNEDGSLTDAGRKRYGPSGQQFLEAKAERKAADKAYSQAFDKANGKNYQIYSLNKKKREAKSAEWDDVIEKAAVRQESNKRYKAAKERMKTDKHVERVDKARDKILAARAVNKEKFAARLDKKLQKGKMTEDEVDYWKKDFDLGTEAVTRGYNQYSSVIRNHGNMKISAINDSSNKKTQAYKDAGRAYCKQVLFDAIYGGMPMTVLLYAGEAANELTKK